MRGEPQTDLRPLYETISRSALHAVKAENVATFLSRKLTGNYQGPLGNHFHTRIEGTRDLFLSRRLVTELQSQGFLQGQTSALGQIEASLFNSQGQGVSEQITRFFDSFLDLTNDGSSQVLRQAVLSEGANLARGFSGAMQRLNQLTADNRQRIDDTVERINNLTGRIAVEVNGQVVIGERQFRGKQGRLVFAYLVCERTRPISREEMATVIWPADLASSWESALSSLTSRVGTLLSSDPLQALGLSLSSDFGQYQIHLPTDVWVDLEAGTSAIDRAEAAVRSGDPGSALGPATVAASIAKRPFLSGIDGFWQDAQRRKLERQLLRALDCICEMQIAVGEPESAVEKAIEAISLDRYRERSHQHLMRAYAATGDQSKAVSVYHQLRKLLIEEIGSDPSPETEALYLALLQ